MDTLDPAQLLLSASSQSLPEPTPTEEAFNINDILGNNLLDANVLNVPLSAEEQGHMMESIATIFELEEEQPKEDEDEDDETEEVVDFEDRERRTERLKGVLPTLAQLWWSDSVHMDLVAEKLADGSRDRKSKTNKTLLKATPFWRIFFCLF